MAVERLDLCDRRPQVAKKKKKVPTLTDAMMNDMANGRMPTRMLATPMPAPMPMVKKYPSMKPKGKK
jgi:hypothetical protein